MIFFNIFLSLFFIIYLIISIYTHLYRYRRTWARTFFLYILKKRKGHRSSLFRERKEYAVYFSVAVPSALYTTQPRDEFLSVVE